MSAAASIPRLFVALVIAMLLSLSLMTSANATTIGVTVNAAEPGDGACSLRQAIEAANTNAVVGGCAAGEAEPVVDVINVPAGTYDLTDGELLVTDSVDIVGAGAATTIIDGGGTDRVFELSDHNSVSISGVTIQNGWLDDDSGAGIMVQRLTELHLLNSVVTDNHAVDFGTGGGIYLSTEATGVLTGTTVSGNTADEDGAGGGIYLDDDSNGQLIGSTVSGNSSNLGGGIYNHGAPLSLLNSTVSGNQAIIGEGGGDGAGIWTNYDVTLENSTVSGNTAEHDGGGIFSDDFEVLITNSTISGNTAANNGGGVRSWGSVRTSFATIASNTATGDGGGFWVIGQLELFGTIVANNSGEDCFNADANFTSDGNNLDSDNTCGLDQANDHPDTNPMLGTLASNGGPTQTHALLAGSPAIDAVAGLTCEATDQRGVTRPQDGDNNGTAVCDIGAFEVQPPPPPTASINDVTVTEGNSGTVDAVFTVTLSHASTGTVSFAYATANGTATVVADYQAAASTVTFAPGDVSETITVKVVGDTVDEPNETFVVNLTAPVGATLADAQGTGTILDDDAPAAGVLPDAALGESHGSAASSGWLPALGLLMGIAAVSFRRTRSRAAIRGR